VFYSSMGDTMMLLMKLQKLPKSYKIKEKQKSKSSM